MPLIFLESFNSPAILLNIGGYQVQMPLDWCMVVGDKDCGLDPEVLPLTSINERGFDAFIFNPVNGFKCEYMPIEIINIYQDVNVYKKEFLFDFLPGLKKSHREFVFNSLTLSGLVDKSIVSIYNVDNVDQRLQWGFDYQTAVLEKNDLEEFSKIKNNNEISSTAVDTIKYKSGLSAWASSLVPWKIYENSYYSLVTESNADGYNFITEKTAKPLLAKRLFVVFSSQYHLATLKKWGYKTFSDVIDESYDLEPDYNKRMRMAWEQVEYLATLDPNTVLAQLTPVFEHNHQLILDRASVYHKIKDFITSFIPK
jgi:hypothetical protein